MNFFLDENFPKSAEDYLISLGHKTFNIRSTHLEGIDDNSIFKLAQEKNAIFFPHNSASVCPSQWNNNSKPKTAE